MIRLKTTAATLGVTALAAASAVLGSQMSASAAPAHPAAGHHFAIARLFGGTAEVELREHFAAEAVLAGLVRSNAANLRDAISGEVYEHTTMYPQFATQARRDRCASAAGLFDEIAADEGHHAAAFTTALVSLFDPRVRVPRPPKVTPVTITASHPACPGTQTQDNLIAAMHGEAFATAKYLAYAAYAASH